MNEIVLTQTQRDLLKKYRQEAFGYLSEIQAANENLKDVIDAAADGTGIEKEDCEQVLQDIVQKFYR